MRRTAPSSSLLALALVAAGPVAAASPLDDVLSAIESLFTPNEPPAGATRPPSSEAEATYADAVRLRDAGDVDRAVRRLEEAADAGHGAAAYELGMLYTQGRAVARDLALGARWINRAADLGDARAQYLVGASLMSGTGTQRDPSRGVGFLARAGEQGHARAQYLLGQAYVDGIGVVRNPAWAARWYGRAARAGHAGAQYAYGVMYASGLGLPRSAGDAHRWLVLAAANGQPGAATLADRVARELPDAVAAQHRAAAARFVPTAQASRTDVATVLFVQYALREAGYDSGPLDGLMGSRTRAGILAYESDLGEPRTGRIGDALLERLIRHTAKPG